jgi:hypothetical protein
LLRNFDQKVYNYRFLRSIMMAFGSFLIGVGPFYAYFIYSQVGFDGLGEVIFEFISAILAFPAGIFMCIVGKRLNKPIIQREMNIEAEKENEPQE